jgi:putative FmdB family regulatory protein
MPTYDYRCKQCGTTHEIVQGFNDPRPTTCPACGGQLVRVFHPVGVVFKGSGFHKTDYSGTGRKKDAGESAPAKTDGEAAKPAAQPAKTDAKPAAPSPPSTKTDAKPTGSS